mgnify:CR=1 FL=1
MVAMCEEGESSRRVSPQEFIENFIRRSQEETPEPASDPGCLMIPCHVNLAPEALGLCDAWDGVNIMSKRLAEMWRVPLLRSNQEIVMADDTVAPVIGKAKKLSIIIRGFKYLADFLVIDILDRSGVSLILGRPFLKTSRATMIIEEDYVDIWQGQQRKRITMVRSTRQLHGGPGIRGFIEENGIPDEDHLDLIMSVGDPIELVWNDLQETTSTRADHTQTLVAALSSEEGESSSRTRSTSRRARRNNTE